MSEPFRNIADVIDVINEIDKVYVTETEHEGEPENYGTFKLTVRVPDYERISLDSEEELGMTPAEFFEGMKQVAENQGQ